MTLPGLRLYPVLDMRRRKKHIPDRAPDRMPYQFRLPGYWPFLLLHKWNRLDRPRDKVFCLLIAGLVIFNVWLWGHVLGAW